MKHKKNILVNTYNLRTNFTAYKLSINLTGLKQNLYLGAFRFAKNSRHTKQHLLLYNSSKHQSQQRSFHMQHSLDVYTCNAKSHIILGK